MKVVLVVVVHPPTFPSTERNQFTMAIFGRAGIYGRPVVTIARTASGGKRHSTREPKWLAFRFEPRSENRGVHRILKAVPHVRGTFIFDEHVELARV